MSAPTKVTADTAKLPLMLTALRLPTFANLWPAFADRADREGWPAARFLAALAELELAERDRRRIQRHLREARLPMGKTLESFDFAAVPTLSKAHVMALAEGDSWRATTSSPSARPVAERATWRPHLAMRSSTRATGCCSPEPRISSSGCKRHARTSRLPRTSPSSTSSTC